MSTNRNISLQIVTEENKADVKRFLHQYTADFALPIRLLKEKETDELIHSIGGKAFCKALTQEGNVLGVIVAEKSAWDSDHFGFGVGKIKHISASNAHGLKYGVQTRQALIKDCMAWMKKRKVKCIMTRADIDDVATTNVYSKNGFQLADVLLTFHMDTRSINPSSNSLPDELVKVRSSHPRDAATLMKIAGTSFTKDHFHRDPRFPRDKSDELFAKWVSNCCHGSASTVLVAAGENDEPYGFITCKIDSIQKSKFGIIDLIAVAPSHRGKHIGTQLVGEAVRWFADKVDVIFVGTQASNYQSIRTYENAGFRLLFAELTLHKWF